MSKNYKVAPTILLTGATDGIGLALARHYKTEGVPLILVGRRPFADTPLPAYFPENSYCQANLAALDAPQIIRRWLTEHNIQNIDILIHNAGVGYYGDTADQTFDSIKQLTAVNLNAPVFLTHQLLSRLRQPGGKVVFISSVVSAVACPEYAVYGATKAALDGFTRNLRIELQGKVMVQVIHPGATRTGMHVKSGLQLNQATVQKFPSAEAVAQKIARAIAGDRPSVTIGVPNKFLRFSGKYLALVTDAFMRRKYLS
jgi:short-subunit dehydrogenase